MSIPRQHADWLQLVEQTGPFLSMPVLLKYLGNGLEKSDEQTDVMRRLREEYGLWEESAGDRAAHHRWCRFVLEDVLDHDENVLAEGQAIPGKLSLDVPEHRETLRPDYVVKMPPGSKEAGKPRMLVQVYPPDQHLDKPVRGKSWAASPGTRMMDLLHHTDVPLGMVTNGERWMLVHAPRNETTGFASWYAWLWQQEQITFRAFRTLLSAERFFAVPDGETLDAMLAESAANQQEVTDQLGYQVRSAVEILVQSLDRADQDYGRELLAGVGETELYEAALTVMMRLVFLFCAEERGLLPDDEFYTSNYAVSSLGQQLRETSEQQGEEVLERRHDAWCRLLSTFRAVHGGVSHDRFNLPPYGGHLFDPDRFPFLEGRPADTHWRETAADPLPVNNRTVLHLLEALQLLQMKVPGGGPPETRRISFIALDIEQIGHVYEGLLDHTAKRASEPILGLIGTKNKEPEVPISKLEDLANTGEAPLLTFIKDETGRSQSALKKGLAAEIDSHDASRFHAVCGGDDLWERVKPFAGLVRLDTFGYPVVIPEGSVYVTEGTDRRSTGTHYTPKSLTIPIVEHTLEPLVYVGPAEGHPKEQWQLKSPAEILELNVCDMACGSGAFLVQACRYLGERLVEAWKAIEEQQPGTVRITPYGEPSANEPDEELIPKGTDERLVYAFRLIAQRCLYGVDKNPLATEMAKLSLWLLTLAKDKPFTFLDHAIRTGDSLVGISSEEQLRRFSLSGEGLDMPMFQQQIAKRLEAARLLRKQLERMPDNSAADTEKKALMLKNAEQQTARLKYAADFLLAASWQPMSERDREAELKKALAHVEFNFKDLPTDELDAEAELRLRDSKCLDPRHRFTSECRLHWPLEYPEVFEQGGFSAFVGNPPFLGGTRISTALGEWYIRHLSELYPGAGNRTDLIAYFFRQAFDLLADPGDLGFVSTNSISETDTANASLVPMTEQGAHVYWGKTDFLWPGTAGVYVTFVVARRGEWNGRCILNDVEVPEISPLMTEAADHVDPHLLATNVRAGNGAKPNAMGFLLSEEEAISLIAENPDEQCVVRRYVAGEDVARIPTLVPDRWAIYFGDVPLEEAERYVASMAIVRERVYPERSIAKNKVKREKWWQFERHAKDVLEAARKSTHCLVVPETSKYVAFARLPTEFIVSNGCIVVASDDFGLFAVVQSTLHEAWARRAGLSKLKTDPRYNAARCFSTFPFPDFPALREAGEGYYRLRAETMEVQGQGFTSLYNRFHDPDDRLKAVEQLREHHIQMDCRVAAAYGWDDLDLDHDFHVTKQGVRFTISEAARREVLQRLLKLNHERYKEEVRQGLHEKKGKGKKAQAKRGSRKKKAAKGPALFDAEGDDETEPTASDSKKPEARTQTAAERMIRPAENEESNGRPPRIDEFETDEVMAAFRQAARNRGWMDREELLKECSQNLGYQRLGKTIKETLKNHLRAALRRKIIESEGNDVRLATTTMQDYWDHYADDLRGTLQSVMRLGTTYDREDVIHATAHHLGFTRVRDEVRDPIKSAINSAIRRGTLGYDGETIWREE